MTPISRNLAQCARLIDKRNLKEFSWGIEGAVKILEKGRIPPRTFSGGRVHQEVEINTVLSKSTYDDLYKESINFLKNSQQMDTVEKTMQIEHIAKKWGNKLNPSNSPDTQTSLGNSVTNHISPKSQTCTLKGVEVMSEIMTVYLEILEEAVKEEKLSSVLLNTNVETFYRLLNACILGWALVPTTASGMKAQNFLYRMEELCNMSPYLAELTPSAITYGAVLRAWVKSTDTPERNGAVEARRLLEHQSRIYSYGVNSKSQPNMYHYNTLMHGYALRGMVSEAESLLKSLENKRIYVDSAKGERLFLSPDVMTYSSCMNVYSKVSERLEGRSAAKRAEDLLYRLYKKYEETGDKMFMPNQVTFGTGM